MNPAVELPPAATARNATPGPPAKSWNGTMPPDETGIPLVVAMDVPTPT